MTTPEPAPHRRDDRPAAPAVSVVVPAKDEIDNIVDLVEEIAGALADRCGFEIIVVDDGSSDGSGEALRALRAARGLPLRILRHETSRGQSTALRSGVRAAAASWIVTLDGDGQNDPRDIPKLIALMNEQADLDLICGIRARRRDNVVKRVSSRVANGVRSRLLGDGVSDTGCGLKLIRRETFLALPFFDHLHRFIPALVLANGGRLACVDVNHRPRRGGRTKYGTLDRLAVGIVDLVGVLWLKRRAKPFGEVREL